MKISYLIIISIILVIHNVSSDQGDGEPSENSSDDGPSINTKFKCGKLEKYRKCGCTCREKCENRLNPDACPKEKKVKGCFCLQGFFRNSAGKCVPADQCDGAHAKKSEDDDEDEDNYLMRGSHKIRGRTTTIQPLFEEDDREVERDRHNQGKPDSKQNDDYQGKQDNRPNDDYEGKPDKMSNDDYQGNPDSKQNDDYQGQPDNMPNDDYQGEDSNTEGIVQGGLPPEHLAEVLEDDSPPKEAEKDPDAGSPQDSSQENLNSKDREGLPNEVTERMYPEDEDCGPNEKYTKCGHKCRESLKFVKKVKMCPQVCQKGCFCKKGFYRDGFKNCNRVPNKYLKNVFGGQTKKGPNFKCVRDNEEYDDCGDRCVELLANLHNRTSCGPHQCVRGCYCIHGFLREGKDGVCTPVEMPDEDDNDIEDEEEGDEENDDEDDDQGSGNRDKEGGRRGPRDDQGNSRDNRRPHKDTPQCPRNETYSVCGNRCMESIENCLSPKKCDPYRCDKGCFCKPGLYRNKFGLVRGPNGACIRPKKCRAAGV